MFILNIRINCVFFLSKNKVYFVLTCEMENSTLRPSDFFSSTWYSETKIQNKIKVIGIGHSCAFYVVFVWLEYIPSIPPHSTYVIIICFVLEAVGSGLTIDVCIYKDNNAFTILMFKYCDTICILTKNTHFIFFD